MFKCINSDTQIDHLLGMKCYITEKNLGIKPRNTLNSENFYVYEYLRHFGEAFIPIDPKSYTGRGGYYLYILGKADIDTPNAVYRVLKTLGIRDRRKIIYFGLKDSRSRSFQYVLVKDPKYFAPYIKLKNIELLFTGLVRGYEKIKILRYHIGNCFKIKLDLLLNSDVDNGLLEFISSIKYIANYYSYQRFGVSRPITHIAGMHLVKERYMDAIKVLITGDPTIGDIDKDYIKSLCRYIINSSKRWMWIERGICRRLIEGYSAKKIMYSLPRYLLKLYIDAFKSYIFNMYLSYRLKYSDLDLETIIHNHIESLHRLEMSGEKVPYVDSSIAELLKILNEYMFKDLEKLNIHDLTDLNIHSSNYFHRIFIKSKIIRPLILPLSNLKINRNELIFCLDKGGYATNLLREIFKNNITLLFHNS